MQTVMDVMSNELGCIIIIVIYAACAIAAMSDYCTKLDKGIALAGLVIAVINLVAVLTKSYTLTCVVSVLMLLYMFIGIIIVVISTIRTCCYILRS